MNALAQEQLQRQQDSIPLLKREIEREFYESIKFCNSCQRPGEWKKRCGRCKEAYYCSRECQKWAWPVHKKHCYAPGDERPARPPPKKPVPRPKADVVSCVEVKCLARHAIDATLARDREGLNTG
jgi:hypothetical protein